ncbi:uncharacterized protein BT62DRAFT_923436 [Guyanagaster necrorhizus]|uniref:Uncharacterized protein n=1 Tax=Guyanagaster necrorhizus TaxID=856835 RepID=A0A9P7VHL9_9AGAR|nr:uncharacterized protein BT62DRAFT_923436 [Guyanagaster necrorhizus MCA 3950]KAG7441208.1 hypothetical protein BT62DRAFT_923436 [Guyanagaster necrorhizus MCA 3950]
MMAVKRPNTKGTLIRESEESITMSRRISETSKSNSTRAFPEANGESTEHNRRITKASNIFESSGKTRKTRPWYPAQSSGTKISKMNGGQNSLTGSRTQISHELPHQTSTNCSDPSAFAAWSTKIKAPTILASVTGLRYEQEEGRETTSYRWEAREGTWVPPLGVELARTCIRCATRAGSEAAGTGACSLIVKCDWTADRPMVRKAKRVATNVFAYFATGQLA